MIRMNLSSWQPRRRPQSFEEQLDDLVGEKIREEFDRIDRNLSVLASSVPSGTVMMHAGQITDDPFGWLICDGRTVSTQIYPDLYANIGTRYGGDDTNFGIPDMRNQIPIGYTREKGEGAGNTGTISYQAGASTYNLLRMMFIIKT